MCLATSASSVPLVNHARDASPIFFLVSAVCFRVLPHEREQNSPRLLCLAWHFGQVFSLYAMPVRLYSLQFRFILETVHHSRATPKVTLFLLSSNRFLRLCSCTVPAITIILHFCSLHIFIALSSCSICSSRISSIILIPRNSDVILRSVIFQRIFRCFCSVSRTTSYSSVIFRFPRDRETSRQTHLGLVHLSSCSRVYDRLLSDIVYFHTLNIAS